MALREVEDAYGARWTVYEVRPSANSSGSPRVRDVFTAGWVCFQTSGERRRLPGIPEGWDQLEDLALLALKDTAIRVEATLPPRR